MAERHQRTADDHGAALAEPAVGDEAAQHRHEVGEAGIEAEQLGGERLRTERPEQRVEDRLDDAYPQHGVDPRRIEQVLHHVEHDERGVAEVGEAFPHFGREQYRQAAWMPEQIVVRRGVWLGRRRRGHE